MDPYSSDLNTLLSHANAEIRRLRIENSLLRNTLEDNKSRETEDGAWRADALRSLQLITEDMAADAIALDDKPLNGRTVAEHFGYQGAAIAALANIVRGILIAEAKNV